MKYYKRLKLYKSSNLVFDPEKIEAYSYGHWKFVTKIKNKVIFNWFRYSASTHKHQCKVSHLLRELKIKIDLYVYDYSGLGKTGLSLSSCLNYFYENLFLSEIKIKRSKNKYKLKSYKNNIKIYKKSIKSLRKLGAKLSKEDIKKIKNKIIENENLRLKILREKRQLIKEKRDVLKPELNNLNNIDLGFFTNLNDLQTINPLTKD
jgi:hypothetical protein